MTSGILMAIISCENTVSAFMDVLMGKFMAEFLCTKHLQCYLVKVLPQTSVTCCE